MPTLPAALTGLRARVVLAPTLTLVAPAVLGFESLNALNTASDRAVQSKTATASVEVLRDSSSRTFESDRAQHLALHATTAKGSDGVREGRPVPAR